MPTTERTRIAPVLPVRDVTAWTTAGVKGRFTPAEDTPYGLREFAHVDPDGNLLRVGSPLTPPGRVPPG